MQLIVTEMPYFLGDCPFYDEGACSLLHGDHCDHFDQPCWERNPDECPRLITAEAYQKKEATT